ncbi:MAG: M16 family metallopeptidase [Flavobacteriales bacterium]
MKKQLFITVFMAAGFSCIAQPQQAENRIKYTEFDMANGLHVILHEDHATPIVAVSVLYHVGSKDEDPTRTGFAHFFEHLMFEGSANMERGEYMKLIEGNGGIINANTSFDRTYYFQVLPSNQLELALWMESERMLQLKIDKVGVETQRGVVKEEMKQSFENRPYGSWLNETFGHAYSKHPYHWTPIGQAQYINEAKLEEFMEFYKTFYVPNNATLCIAGDINPADAKKLAEKYFSEIPKGTKPIPRNTIVEPEQKKEVRDTIFDQIQLPGVIMAYHTPAQGTADYYALSMLSQLLSQGKSSRFQKSIVDEQQKAVQVIAYNVPTEDPGLVIMLGIAAGGITADALETSMNVEIEKVKNELISDEEFTKLKNQIENDFIGNFDNIQGIAENLANYHVYYGDANLINTELNRYLKVTREDIQRVAKKYLANENRVVLYYLPKTQN